MEERRPLRNKRAFNTQLDKLVNKYKTTNLGCLVNLTGKWSVKRQNVQHTIKL